MTKGTPDLANLAQHLNSRREAILLAWRSAVRKDPSLTSSDALPREDLYDHIPALLVTFSRELAAPTANEMTHVSEAAHSSAAAHGLQRWQQGYDLREVTRELGKLNECMVSELQDYTAANPELSRVEVATAHRLWAALCSAGIEESVAQYFQLQQQEAAGHVKDLESALQEIRAVEQQRGDLWHQAAHDLRGNLGIVANATVGLTNNQLRESSRDEFIRILMRNVTSLHHLLDDVTSLARLQAGRETRRIEALDVSSIMQQLCEGIRPVAQQRHLFLRCEGPPGFAADGDAIKIRRVAQNLILNAVKYTVTGGITVKWGDSTENDAKRWELCVFDTGPGLHTKSGQPLAGALERPDLPSLPCDADRGSDVTREQQSYQIQSLHGAHTSPSEAPGEGIGLSIVKRLCDILDATIELKSEPNVGTSFRILFPRQYNG
jgi:signal transduction histidine kinase